MAAAAQLAQLGLRPKNLRVLKSAVDREIGLIEQVLLPALRSNRPERRREGLDQLDDIVQASTQLRQLLLARGVRRLTGDDALRQSLPSPAAAPPQSHPKEIR